MTKFFLFLSILLINLNANGQKKSFKISTETIEVLQSIKDDLPEAVFEQINSNIEEDISKIEIGQTLSYSNGFKDSLIKSFNSVEIDWLPQLISLDKVINRVKLSGVSKVGHDYDINKNQNFLRNIAGALTSIRNKY